MSTNAVADTGNPTDKKGLAAVPVALTVLATIFAGMSSSEMTRSMFYRSLAAQHQAKAGDQWALFQAKKIRGSTFEAANDMAMLFSVKPFDESMANGLLEALKPSESDPAAAKISALPAAGKTLRTALESEDLKPALRFIGNTDLPTIEAKPVETETLGELLQAIRSRVPETKTESLVAKIPPGAVEAAIETATSNADAFDRACEPVVKSVRTLEKAVGDVDRLASGVAEPSNEIKSLAGAVHGAALSLRFAAQDLTARRYDREAKFNQQIAELYEIQVRLAGHESERHRLRSKNFFYAMLFAQAGVTIASLALAKSRQSAFWFIAGLAGLAAVATGAYVYLAM